MSGEGKRMGVKVSFEDVTKLVISKSDQRRKQMKGLASNFTGFFCRADVKFSESCNKDVNQDHLKT